MLEFVQLCVNMYRCRYEPHTHTHTYKHTHTHRGFFSCVLYAWYCVCSVLHPAVSIVAASQKRHYPVDHVSVYSPAALPCTPLPPSGAVAPGLLPRPPASPVDSSMANPLSHPYRSPAEREDTGSRFIGQRITRSF